MNIKKKILQNKRRFCIFPREEICPLCTGGNLGAQYSIITMIFWVTTFYAVYEGMGSKRKGRRELLKNELPKNTWGKNGVVHRAEGMPVLLVLWGN